MRRRLQPARELRRTKQHGVDRGQIDVVERDVERVVWPPERAVGRRPADRRCAAASPRPRSRCRHNEPPAARSGASCHVRPSRRRPRAAAAALPADPACSVTAPARPSVRFGCRAVPSNVELALRVLGRGRQLVDVLSADGDKGRVGRGRDRRRRPPQLGQPHRVVGRRARARRSRRT